MSRVVADEDSATWVGVVYVEWVAPPNPPSRRLVMQREGQRTHALVLSEVECILGKKPADAPNKRR